MEWIGSIAARLELYGCRGTFLIFNLHMTWLQQILLCIFNVSAQCRPFSWRKRWIFHFQSFYAAALPLRDIGRMDSQNGWKSSLAQNNPSFACYGRHLRSGGVQKVRASQKRPQVSVWPSPSLPHPGFAEIRKVNLLYYSCWHIINACIASSDERKFPHPLLLFK